MVVLACLIDAEAQSHHIDETRLGNIEPARGEIVAGMEIELIGAGAEIAAFDKRRVAAAVSIGSGIDQALAGRTGANIAMTSATSCSLPAWPTPRRL